MPTDLPVAVIFTNQRTDLDADGYLAMAERMEELARAQPGFVGIESVRQIDGAGITVSYWTDQAAAAAWKRQSEHLVAQALGRERWYDAYTLRVATVERQYQFVRPVFHLALPGDWETALATGEYAVSTRGLTVAEQGFMHCAFVHQMRGVAERFYADVDELTILHIDRPAIAAHLRIEPAADGIDELFPHIYATLPIGAVTATTAWRRSETGWAEPPVTVPPEGNPPA